MQLLAFRAPNGQVFILDSNQALPPLIDGYEWTLVVQPDTIITESGEARSTPRPAPPKRPARAPGILDVLEPLLTPREGQSPEERAEELIAALPPQMREKLIALYRVFMPDTPTVLPPFPRG